MIHFTQSGYGRYGFETLDDNQYNLYLFQLWTYDPRQEPQSVYKVGITSAKDPYDRLRYNAIADKITISQVFPYACLLACRTFPDKATANAAERKILGSVKPKDFLIESKISGITEMRRWDQEEVDKIILMLPTL